MIWVILLAVLAASGLLAMRKLTLSQRIARLESRFVDEEFKKFAKCWESNFVGLGVVFRMEKTLLQVVANHNETVLACEAAKKKIVDMAQSISLLSDENEELKSRSKNYEDVLARSQRQADRITQLETTNRVLDGRVAVLQSELQGANGRAAHYSQKLLDIREIVNK